MLMIRQAQREAFGVASRAALAEQLGDRFAAHFPVQYRFSGAQVLRRAAGEAITRGQAIGCTTEREAAQYFLLSGWLGQEFATDPRHPWAEAWLAPSPNTTVGFRLDALLDLAHEQIEAVQGPYNGLLVRAMLRVRRLQPADFVAAGADAATCAAWLRELLPGWSRQEAALQRVAEAAPAAAARWGMDDSASTAVYSLHAALLGQGFASDPLYPWAGAALAGKGPDRAGQLFAASLRYVNAILG